MNLKLILLFVVACSIYYVVSATSLGPSNLYLYSVNANNKIEMTVVNIASGVATKSVLPIKFQHDITLIKFLGVDSNQNFLLLAMNPRDAYGIITISQAGKLVTGPSYVGPILADYEWYATSLQYDSTRNAVYLVTSASNTQGPGMFIYDFANSSTSALNLTMPDVNPPNGCFDGVNNYYIMDITDKDYSQFELGYYSFADNQQHESLNVTGIPANSDTYLYCANKQVYTVVYNTMAPKEMTLFLMDVQEATATQSFHIPNTGMMNSLQLWFSDNYFVILTSSNKELFITTVDLNTNQVVLSTQIKGKINLQPQASGVF
ncbi:hypothetical protein DFA_11805 [Cavenderia fasciculata]|uniref:Uncharacterized protein n=1 Tax=Cavenderia fasciculata TaxID=261658 RepID=F4QE95_CACFS|nr:uncharacterized protein DFA_11805 [Cavenderia fasciculata]EGG14042.1 hypothetical protein DFA_11805 [Cavenderia fasciculata]|eukprot:XP_004350750.1 hypothetical protein DFA_11805 [Cavenderia fasciculata]